MMNDLLNTFYREICSYAYKVDVDAPPGYQKVIDMIDIQKVYEKFCAKQWYSEMIKPEVNKLVVVMDDMDMNFQIAFGMVKNGCIGSMGKAKNSILS